MISITHIVSNILSYFRMTTFTQPYQPLRNGPFHPLAAFWTSHEYQPSLDISQWQTYSDEGFQKSKNSVPDLTIKIWGGSLALIFIFADEYHHATLYHDIPQNHRAT
jgi:hypothetical protein